MSSNRRQQQRLREVRRAMERSVEAFIFVPGVSRQGVMPHLDSQSPLR